MADKRMKLELLLKGVDQMSGVIKKQSPLLKNLDRDATKAYNSLKKLFSLSPKNTFANFGKQSSGEFRKANSEALKLQKTLQSIGKIKSPKIVLPSGSTGGGFPKIDVNQGRRELDRIYGARRRSNKYLNGLANLNDRILEPARDVKNVWRDQMDSLRPYIDETKKLYRNQETFKLLNLSEADNQKAFAAVRRIVKEVKGASLSDATSDITDLQNALGNVDSAVRALPFATKYRTNFTALYGDKYSDAEIGQQIQSSFKVAEMIGATIKGQAETERVVDVLSKISNSTGGRVTGADFHAMMKTGSTATKNLSTTGMMNISSLIEEMGGGRVGTSMMSMFQALVAATMKQSAKERFDYFGLIDKDKIEYGKGQRIKNLKPGANLLGTVMQEDPLKAADMLREAMAKKGIDVTDARKVDEELSILFQNRNANALMSQLINQREQVVKEADRANESKGVLGMDQQLANTELKKIQEFEAAIKNFKTEAGIPLIQVGTQITSALTPFIRLAGEYPTVTKLAVASLLLGKGIAGIAQTASTLSGGGGLASFFRNAETSANRANQSFRSASGTVSGLSSKMSGLKALGKVGLAVVVAEGTALAIAGVAQMIDEAVERPRELKIKVKGLDKTYDALMGSGILYEKPGDYGKDEKNKAPIDAYAKQIFDAMNNKNDLVNALHPEKMPWGWEYLTNPNPFGIAPGQKDGGATFNPEVAVQRWRAGGGLKIHDPNVLARLLAYLKAGAKDDEGNVRLNGNDFQMILPALERIAGKDNLQTALSILEGKTIYQPPKEDPKGFWNAKTNTFELPKQPAAKPMATIDFLKKGGFKEDVKDLSGNVGKSSQAFAQIVNPVSGTAKNFFDLTGKGTILGGSLSGLNTNANSSVGAINSMTGAALNFASTVGSLKISAPSFGGLNLTGFGTFKPLPSPPGLGGNLELKRILGGGRAKGGSVSRGKLYEVGERGREWFAPGESGTIISNDILRKAERETEKAQYLRNLLSGENLRRSFASGDDGSPFSSNTAAAAAVMNNRRETNSTVQNITIHAPITLYSDNPNDARQAIKVLEREIARIKSELAGATNSRAVARKVAAEGERDAGRV